MHHLKNSGFVLYKNVVLDQHLTLFKINVKVGAVFWHSFQLVILYKRNKIIVDNIYVTKNYYSIICLNSDKFKFRLHLKIIKSYEEVRCIIAFYKIICTIKSCCRFLINSLIAITFKSLLPGVCFPLETVWPDGIPPVP